MRSTTMCCASFVASSSVSLRKIAEITRILESKPMRRTT